MPKALSRHALIERFQTIRNFTEHLCDPLETEDYVVQSMPDVSPTKWHLSHTSWFFENFVLDLEMPSYRSPKPEYAFLFNSYYVQSGERHYRPHRGLITRPTVEEVFKYRQHVSQHVEKLIDEASQETVVRIAPIIELGLNHEQQHQELLLTDIKHVFSVNPIKPAYAESQPVQRASATPLEWIPFESGVHEVGHPGRSFAYDNEGPRHKVYLEPYEVGSRLVTNREYLDFIEDGGYERAELWLTDARPKVDEEGWRAPIYWEKEDAGWRQFTLAGMHDLADDEPVCHLSYYEADAFARWADCRLPTEMEWEVAADNVRLEGNFVDSAALHPTSPPKANSGTVSQLFGDVWEWTGSHYSPYPGYKPAPGAVGEYNGKFMCNQFVLRGGSCATSITHIRSTYRNFFPADARWQFAGLRLARSV